MKVTIIGGGGRVGSCADICLSVPSVVSRRGVDSHVNIKLWPKELMGLQASARALKETLAKVRA